MWNDRRIVNRLSVDCVRSVSLYFLAKRDAKLARFSGYFFPDFERTIEDTRRRNRPSIMLRLPCTYEYSKLLRYRLRYLLIKNGIIKILRFLFAVRGHRGSFR